MTKISMEEWQNEIDRLYADDEGLTIVEIARIMERSIRVTRRIVRKGIIEGLYIEGHAQKKNALGHMRRTSVFRVVNSQKKKKKS